MSCKIHRQTDELLSANVCSPSAKRAEHSHYLRRHTVHDVYTHNWKKRRRSKIYFSKTDAKVSGLKVSGLHSSMDVLGENGTTGHRQAPHRFYVGPSG